MSPTRARFEAPDWIRNQPVRRKLAAFGIAAAITATLAAAVVLLAHDLLLLRRTYRSDLLSLSQIVAENAIGPVAFQDAPAATTVLATLRSKSSIRGAVITLPGKPDFAVFGEPPAESARLRPGVSDAFDGWLLHTATPIGDHAGATVHIVADLRPAVWETVGAFAEALVGALLLALLFSSFVSRRLRRYILVPVENLHRVADRLAQRADYSERAAVLSNDEMGHLTVTFNRMLDRLQENDRALRASNEGLNREIENRQRLETELIEASRLAGMAEVATGVLHNVGNVLNSVNVSTNILREQLHGSKPFAMVERTVTLLREKGDDLPRYIADDPRGRLLPTFLIKLGEQLAELRQELVKELDSLAHNIDHIKQVVSVQQKYARAAGVIVSVAPAELFEAALRITALAIERDQVTVAREFAACPEIVTDRDQVLQIIVNFVTNAIQAVKCRPPGSRHLRLGLAAHADTVDFVVEDNGIGIAPEHLQRVFQHGFTTRKDGHGFGLHSGSLAAKNLNGTLQVHSDGVDRGSRFTLTLPLSLSRKQLPS